MISEASLVLARWLVTYQSAQAAAAAAADAVHEYQFEVAAEIKVNISKRDKLDDRRHR
jgi:hypothetical protein